MKKKVVVIGGGIAGLSAGVYALRCDFDVTILEGHRIAGGNCTSWERNGYLFEGGMHWLTGSDEREPVNKLWRTIGALNDDVIIHTPEPFIEYDHKGTPIRIYRDVDDTERHLISLSPADEKEIRKLCDNIRKIRGLAMPVVDIRGVRTTRKNRMPLSLLLPALSAIRMMRKFSKLPREDYLKRFGHEGIREMIRSCTDDNTGIAPILFTMGVLSRGDGGFPEGGSLPFVQRIIHTFEALGGNMLCSTRADRVIMENGKAVCVMASEKQIPADAVIITADTMAIDHLFETPLRSPWLDEMRTVAKPTMATFISLGLDVILNKYHRYFVFKPERSITLAAQTYEHLGVNNYSADPVYSPAGKTAVTIQLGGDTYDFWKKAKEDCRYTEEKEKIADAVAEALISYIPEIEGHIEVRDVATPLTYERYCGNWKGSWMTEMTAEMKFKEYPAVIKGLDGVYFAGQRMIPPGGLPAALMSGRRAVQYLCRDTATTFISEE